MYSSKKNKNNGIKLISIAGLIGAGKSTLADNLGKILKNSTVHHEAVETNDILPLFYENMSKWGFPLQVSLLTQRHAQLQKINWADSTNNIHIEDRFMDEDHVFATTLFKQGYMSEIEYNIYNDLVKTYEKSTKYPDLIVFLDVSPQVSIDRIKQRGRKMETNIPIEYIETLHAEYKNFITWISRKIPVIIIDWNEYIEPSIVATMILEMWENTCNNLNKPN